jgi:uncharacterized membrane protein YhhN
MVVAVMAGAAAIADWWAVATDRRSAERVLKPLTMVALIWLALVVGDAPNDVRGWLVAGAVLGLVGDVALLGDGESEFMVGLGAFALGHVAYVVAAVNVGFSVWWAIPGVVVMVALLSYRFVGRTLPGARRHGGPVLAGAVVSYAFVISAMVISAWGSARLLAACGAVSFAVSDWVLGHRRFVGELPGGRLAVMVPYHIGQAVLIVGLATA